MIVSALLTITLFSQAQAPASSDTFLRPSGTSPNIGEKLDSAAVWTLEGCKAWALEANKGLKVAEEKVTESEAMEKAALWQMLPKVSANGTYNWMERSVNLLSDEQKERLNNLGPTVAQGVGSALQNEFGNLPIGGDLIAQALTNMLAGSDFMNTINGVGQRITDALETDTRNVMAGTVTVTQPVFMGGKLWALHKSASLMAELSGMEYDKKREEIMIGVEEAYWQVVSVKHKKELAEQYAALLDTLTKDVEEMVAAEVATKGDLTKVSVKRNEAQMNLTKARNGLVLAKMLLAQRCGQPLWSEFDVEDVLSHSSVSLTADSSPSLREQEDGDIVMDSVYSRRREMRMLGIADSVAMQGVTIARSTLLPNVVATGGYLVSKPNLFNGFANEFGGTFFAGVVVNVPILHPGGIYSLKAAKAKRREAQWQMEEAREMIELQVKKVSYELELAEKKLTEAESNLANAEENLRLANESFHAGVVSSSDLMAAQTAWMQAKSEVVDAEIEIEMSKVYLKQALGE